MEDQREPEELIDREVVFTSQVKILNIIISLKFVSSVRVLVRVLLKTCFRELVLYPVRQHESGGTIKQDQLWILSFLFVFPSADVKVWNGVFL